MSVKLKSLTAAVVLSLGSSLALASETERLMELLVQRGILTAEEAQAIRDEAAAEREAERTELVAQAKGFEPTASLPVDEDAEIHVRRFGVQTADGSERFRMRGRLQVDWAAQNFGDDIQQVARQSNEFPEYGVILRRVRLGALGLMRERFEWQIEADFAENEVDLANVYMAYLFDHGRLAVGHFKEPFGMEYATSSRYITFMERSAAADAYKVNREPGIMYETLQPRWYLGAGIFGNGIDFNREVREGWAVSLRTSFAPLLNGSDFVHIGGGVNHRRNGLDKGLNEYLPVRLRTREGTRVIDARLIGRDDIEGVEDFTRMNLEFAAGFGSWWMQSEYYRVNLNLDPTRGDVRIADDSITQDGWYIHTGFFLTGESRNYRAFSGDFGNLTPFNNFDPRNGTWGAFELALGYSVADSLEHSRPGRGQRLERWVAGLNWYLTPEVLMKFNAIYLEGERDGIEDDGWVYGARFQFMF
ncbi:MAG: OprO/OprP family phosphate-selective porin [Wenzhouxiangella sp.]